MKAVIDIELVRRTQAEIGEWQSREFRPDGQPPNWFSDTLIIAEETGEVCRCFVKRQQNIRGGSDHWDEELRKELGDVVITVLAFGENWGLDVTDHTDEHHHYFHEDFSSSDVALLLVGAVGNLNVNVFTSGGASNAATYLSEILVLTAQIAALEGMVWNDVLAERWAEVQQRRFAK